ncbi:MAG TPA: HAD family hydrolase, partial [Steroidobacteraceae bacterium]|nr:HAD family hydrolase [Steroidobacteraceae bacterium]
MNIVLFDIDDTLTRSQSIDDEIYLRSLSEVFGFVDVCRDWASYRHTTDSGILREVFDRHLGRAPTAAEVAAFRGHFVAAIAAESRRTPFRQIPGADRVLSHLSRLPDHGVGLATGGWKDSARCKMRSAAIHHEAIPCAAADDA